LFGPAARTDSAAQDFKSATSAVASKAMRNELNALIEGIEDPAARHVSVRAWYQ